MRKFGLACIGVLLAGAAAAESVPAPKVATDDSWTYQSTVENRKGWQQTRNETTVVRASAASIVLSVKPAGSTMPPTEQLVGPDWSRLRSVNGHETVVNQPLSFPLRIGKSWEVEFTETQPNRQLSSEHLRVVYKVTGWEDVVVPAGTFHALKIEADGTWSAVLAPAATGGSATRVDAQGATTVVQTGRTTPTAVSGRNYKAFWYVPEVKKWVKAVEESYDGNGVRTERLLSELASYKVSN